MLESLEIMAELDLIFARGKLSVDYRMSPPQFNQEGRLVLRGARHPLLEAIFRGDPTLAKPVAAVPIAPVPVAPAPVAAGEPVTETPAVPAPMQSRLPPRQR